MFESLKNNIREVISVSEAELDLIDKYFTVKTIRKKSYLLQDNEVCDFIGYIESGIIRHFHIKDGIERTCDISFEHSWVTDFESFTYNLVSRINLQALDDTCVFVIHKTQLNALYQECSKFETFGRLMAQQVAQRATDIAISLSSEKPEERFANLLVKQPNILKRIPQKYVANLLGISPESLSRIRKRIFHRLKS